MIGSSQDAVAPSTAQEAVSRAFGAENRARRLNQYFADIPQVTPAEAWLHVYRLLLWVDRTTGLAHCYESDKCQPGRPWYARSLAFHGWVAGQLGTTPATLGENIDWLFSKASLDLAATAAAANRSVKVQQQRAPYEGLYFPEPGEDPELVEIILHELQDWLPSEPPVEVLRELTERIHAHMTKENRRKNLVGEGFEDTLAVVLRRVPGIAEKYDISTRAVLHHLPGFNPLPANAKPREVDLALVRKSDQRRILVTAKWSIRADREEQFGTDFADYARCEALGQDFEYVLITNEFDAARLVNACERRRENALLFTDIVHVNAQGPVITYGQEGKGSALKMRQHVEQERLVSLAAWLGKLVSA